MSLVPFEASDLLELVDLFELVDLLSVNPRDLFISSGLPLSNSSTILFPFKVYCTSEFLGIKT